MKNKLKRPKKTTHKPNFILRFKGRLDYKKGGVSVVQSYVDHLVEKADSFVAKEYKCCENILKETRLKVGQALCTVKKVSDRASTDTVNSISLNKEKNTSMAIKTLVEAYEEVQHIHSVFAERVLFIRTYNDSKIAQYISAVSADEVHYEYSNEAHNKYLSMHKKSDDALVRSINGIYENGNEGG